jgi:hypothetical protein
MKALRRGVAVDFSAALSGTMLSSRGRDMKLPNARRAWRRLINQDWDRKLLTEIFFRG